MFAGFFMNLSFIKKLLLQLLDFFPNGLFYLEELILSAYAFLSLHYSNKEKHNLVKETRCGVCDNCNGINYHNLHHQVQKDSLNPQHVLRSFPRWFRAKNVAVQMKRHLRQQSEAYGYKRKQQGNLTSAQDKLRVADLTLPKGNHHCTEIT